MQKNSKVLSCFEELTKLCNNLDILMCDFHRARREAVTCLNQSLEQKWVAHLTVCHSTPCISLPHSLARCCAVAPDTKKKRFPTCSDKVSRSSKHCPDDGICDGNE